MRTALVEEAVYKSMKPYYQKPIAITHVRKMYNELAKFSLSMQETNYALLLINMIYAKFLKVWEDLERIYGDKQ